MMRCRLRSLLRVLTSLLALSAPGTRPFSRLHHLPGRQQTGRSGEGVPGRPVRPSDAVQPARCCNRSLRSRGQLAGTGNTRLSTGGFADAAMSRALLLPEFVRRTAEVVLQALRSGPVARSGLHTRVTVPQAGASFCLRPRHLRLWGCRGSAKLLCCCRALLQDSRSSGSP